VSQAAALVLANLASHAALAASTVSPISTAAYSGGLAVWDAGISAQVMMCTSIPAQLRRTREWVVVLGSRAGHRERRVAPSTSWVAFSAWAKVSSAAGMSWSVMRW
jgi:hypothetical protein